HLGFAHAVGVSAEAFEPLAMFGGELVTCAHQRLLNESAGDGTLPPVGAERPVPRHGRAAPGLLRALGTVGRRRCRCGCRRTLLDRPSPCLARCRTRGRPWGT